MYLDIQYFNYSAVECQQLGIFPWHISAAKDIVRCSDCNLHHISNTIQSMCVIKTKVMKHA